jgi:hypothetical protein
MALFGQLPCRITSRSPEVSVAISEAVRMAGLGLCGVRRRPLARLAVSTPVAAPARLNRLRGESW